MYNTDLFYDENVHSNVESNLKLSLSMELICKVEIVESLFSVTLKTISREYIDYVDVHCRIHVQRKPSCMIHLPLQDIQGRYFSKNFRLDCW